MSHNHYREFQDRYYPNQAHAQALSASRKKEAWGVFWKVAVLFAGWSIGLYLIAWGLHEWMLTWDTSFITVTPKE